ncbi:3-methylornithine--L-lysine ligase PylC [Carboxydothermus ferrireducens]|uniref:Pyrrolysine biosynthesis protein PylC n=1 Tax=Carboxydothermus ferrireducens DSM 11255 TaxID=1119529 RepID=A0ABX2RBE4_9THEO|nr:3-methylornithine--L-lysine ligase PylC [Carboxydothermus ferrireducens]NYE58503.1 pyrrolysine biosynthesis protein PylC [Carboxydothermus ferrireducens DSM 11255]
MRVAVIGGKLQGVEVCYLAKKAGWEVILIDKNITVPAKGLSESFFSINVFDKKVADLLKNTDLIIPALESLEVLQELQKIAVEIDVPLLFDLDSYKITSSKIISNKLIRNLKIPQPDQWPNCKFPVIIKPSFSSGSKGVRKISNYLQLSNLNLKELVDDWVIEEYLDGPSFSIEVAGFKENYRTLQITELQMDPSYDCKRVIAPANLQESLQKKLENIALTIAQKLRLKGIMDVEVILSGGQLKVLEIDARIPSQTPTVVFHASGVNMLKEVGEAFKWGKELTFQKNKDEAVIYEHIRVDSEKIEVLGENIMTTGGPLTLMENFFGADEAITNYTAGQNQWIATVIFKAKTLTEVWEKHKYFIENLKRTFKIQKYIDNFPN